MATETELLAELLASIDRRWQGETDRKIENAVSPRMAKAIVAGFEAQGDAERADFWREFVSL